MRTMKTQSLPKPISDKLPGAVCKQYKTCGKADCHCAHGQQHGPYWYRFWRDENGKLRKVYVRQADLERVRAACAARQAEEREVRWALGLGEAALEWLVYEDEALITEKHWQHMLDYDRVLQILDDAASGRKGSAMMSIRAFKIVDWACWYLIRQAEQERTASLIGLVRAPDLGPDDEEELVDIDEPPVDDEPPMNKPAGRKRRSKEPPEDDVDWRSFAGTVSLVSR